MKALHVLNLRKGYIHAMHSSIVHVIVDQFLNTKDFKLEMKGMRKMCYGSRIKWPLLFFFSRGKEAILFFFCCHNIG